MFYAASYSQEQVQALLKESVKMKMFNHPNVMSLLGVCLDAGVSPYIVLPFMSGGDLLSHVKRNQSSLVLENDEDEKIVSKYLILKHVWELAISNPQLISF